MYYLASPDNLLADFKNYIMSEFDIMETNIINIDFDYKNRRDICYELRKEEFKNKIITLPGDKVLIMVRGFEGLLQRIIDQEKNVIGEHPGDQNFSYEYGYDSGRAGHDYDQNVIDLDYRLQLGVGKKIIVITQISPSKGEDISVRTTLLRETKILKCLNPYLCPESLIAQRLKNSCHFSGFYQIAFMYLYSSNLRSEVRIVAFSSLAVATIIWSAGSL